MSWSEFVEAHTSGGRQMAVQRASERLAGPDGVVVKQPLISRWVLGKAEPSVAYAAAFARACNVDVRLAFVAAGFLTETEAFGAPLPDRPVDLSTLDASELADEVKRRLTAPVRVVSGRQVKRSGSTSQSSASEPPQPTGSPGAGGRRRG